MSLDILGDGFDLHGGGRDLAFPHHENERAQAVAEGRPFARHWVHNGWVEVEGTKMSKSLGNFTSLTDLLARSDARAYRLLVLRAHYRSPIEVTAGTVADAEKALARLDTAARRFSVGDLLAASESGYVVEGTAPAIDIDPGALAEFRSRMDDDLDTPGALAGIFDLVTAAHTSADAGDEVRGRHLALSAAVLAAALGLSLRGDAAAIDEDTAKLVAERDAARSTRDFARADALRDELTALGWTVEDTPAGTAVRR
jgi:cysteinyl-tRNA synthetase